MNRRIFFYIATMLICGSVFAQESQHYPLNPHDFPNNMNMIAKICINGVEQTSNAIEIGAFNGNTITGSKRIQEYGSNHYFRINMLVYGNSSSYEVTFKLFNHDTGDELNNCIVTFEGNPYTVTWESDATYGKFKNPVVLNFVTEQSFNKEITGYGNSTMGGYYLIASPIDDVNPTEIEGMIANPTENYDLYWFDQTQNLEWINYKSGNFNMVRGMGYLYANKYGVTLNFTGTPIEGSTYEVSLVRNEDAEFAGWNLVGNPFAEHSAYIDRDCFVMNTEGRAEIIASDTRSIEPMEGAFVIATENDEGLSFSTEAPAKGSMVTLNLSKGCSVIDRAMVRFSEGRQLPKFQLNPSHTKLYIPQGENNFAVVRSASEGEMPVNFKAESNGTYTLNFDVKNVEMNYLHLIDNMNGTDIDLLVSPNYTFEAKTTDYASRFKLVFVCRDANDDNETFAYFNGSVWSVSNMGEATFQVIDMHGRVLHSETINGNAMISTSNLNAGVYVMRLINKENVKTQKIIIK